MMTNEQYRQIIERECAIPLKILDECTWNGFAYLANPGCATHQAVFLNGMIAGMKLQERLKCPH